MSQVLVRKPTGSEMLLFQDLYFPRKKAEVKSTVKEASCIICSKSLDDGVSVTARKTGQKMRLFCQFHLPRE
ncbi:MAG TPA: hypothetical protein VJ792_06135 [Candidatus Nitrosotalea sp.]|nr:hypothetical protein [Candidatus Nitrosotalea sp.]